MKLAAIIFADFLGAFALMLITHFLRKQFLTIGLGVAWFFTIGGLMCIASIPPLGNAFITLSSLFFSSPPYLVALTIFLLFFLIYVSVVISTLQRQIRELSQFIALEKNNLKK